MTYEEVRKKAVEILPLQLKNIQVDACTFVSDVNDTINSLIYLIDKLIERHKTSARKKELRLLIEAYRDDLKRIVLACLERF